MSRSTLVAVFALSLGACGPSLVLPSGPDGAVTADVTPTKDTITPTVDVVSVTDTTTVDAVTMLDATLAPDTATELDAVVTPDGVVATDAMVAPDVVAVDRPAGMLPNLIPVVGNPQIQERNFAAGACEVVEGCTVAGNRRLLRFDLSTPNIGRADLYLGSPTAAGHPPGRFEFGTCHRHWHLRGYADYRLVDGDGVEVGRGHKQSFCLLDSGRYMGLGTDIPAAMRYNCGNQGIHAGWMDVYGRGLDCQYVDITGVAPGRYRIRASINIERVVEESSYDDNVTYYDITIPPPPSSDAGTGDAGAGDAGIMSMDPTLACPSALTGVNRNCGWQVEGAARTCTPGAMVTVGCNQGCMPPLGSCAGDPMIRICPGSMPCTDLTAVTTNDDSCPPADGGPTRLCSMAPFVCPASGRYLVMTGAYAAGGAYECHLETR
jgi:hypothetical protein